MNSSNYRFTLDMQSNISQVSLPVRKGDTSRKLYINLTDSGSPYFIEDGCRAVFSGRKADDNALLNDCIIEKNTTIRYDFTEQTTSFPGVVDCEIRLYGTEGNLITSPRFILVVDERVVYDEDFPLSESEKSALDNIILTETARQDAETARVLAEEERESAEELRQTRFNNFMESAEENIGQAVTNAEIAYGQTQEALNTANEAVAKANAAAATAVSPTVSVSDIEGGHRVTITDKDGTETFDVLDGENATPYTYGTTDLVAGSSALDTGKMYLVYE